MDPRELRQQRADKLDAAQKIVDTCKTEGRSFTDEEREQYQTLLTEARQLAVDIRDLEDLAEQRSETTVTETRQSQPIEVGSITPSRGEGEGDKRSSFADYLRCLAVIADSKASHRQKEQAEETLANVYEVRYNAWDVEERGRDVRAMAQQSGVSGGYTVPTQFVNRLMEVAGETAIVRPRAMTLPMSVDEAEIPILDQTTAPSAGNTAFYGGVTGQWTADEDDKPETEPRFRQAKITAHELTGYTEVRRSLVQNSAISVDALLTRLFGGAIAWYEDYAFLRGNGVGKPLGVLNSPALVKTTARGANGAISFADARKVWVRVPMSSRGRAVWVVSQGAEDAVLDMTGTANSVFVPSGLVVTGTNVNAAAQPVNYALLGRPVLVSEKLPALNTLGDFGCYDFGQYIVGDRRVMEIAASEHFKFRGNLICYRFIHKVGGMPWQNGPITLSDATTTVSPFVALEIKS